ncbi:MAG: hypothetical protein AB8E82_17540 [Aureispira sp.]
MQLLDHFEESPTPAPITKKTYIQYSCVILVIVGGTFLLSAWDIVAPFPLFEMPVGWLLMFCLWLTTFNLYKKVIQSSAGALITSVLGFMIGGACAIFVLSELLGLGRSDYFMAAATIWLFYTLGSLLCFKIIRLAKK